MTEMCFQRCVVNVHVRQLDTEEVNCVDSCSQKFITYNNRLMQSFVKFQGELVNRRVKEAEEQQAVLERQQLSQEQQQTPAVLETQNVLNQEVAVSAS